MVQERFKNGLYTFLHLCQVLIRTTTVLFGLVVEMTLTGISKDRGSSCLLEARCVSYPVAESAVETFKDSKVLSSYL